MSIASIVSSAEFQNKVTQILNSTLEPSLKRGIHFMWMVNLKREIKSTTPNCFLLGRMKMEMT